MYNGTNHLLLIKFLIIFLFFVGRWVQGNWKKDGKLSYNMQELQYVIILGLMIYGQWLYLFDLENIFAWENVAIFISVIPLKLVSSNVGYGMGYNSQWWYLGTTNFFDKQINNVVGTGKYKTLWLGIIYFVLICLGLINY